MGNTIQTSTVPAGITSVIITAVGADGGGPSGGSGATASGTFSVSVGQELELVVGIAGEVTNGGGGSGVRTTVGQNVLVIGGGGGGGGIIVRAPFDQNVLVTDKTAGVDNSTTGENVIIDGGGEGGRASENGGNGGGSGTNLGGSGGSNGNGGGSGLGGGGGGLFTDGVSNSFGGFGGSSDFGGTGNGVGGGGGGSGLAGGGGGGGGYSGGGGGADQNGGGGGGSFVDATGTNPVFTTGANAIGSIQNGSVTLCYISGALPATMTYFRSTPQDKRIQLEWGTAREVNNNGFEVQRSTDEISFVNIAWVAGRGSSNEEHFYQFIDEEVQASTTYFYRLKQVDTDGTASYSSVRSAMVTDRSLVQVSEFFPNPVGKALGIANIRVNMAEAGQMTIQLIDSQGRLVKELSKAYSSGQSTLAIPIREVPTGQYFVKMRLREEVAYRKLVVN